jgi:hypothetical protein
MHGRESAAYAMPALNDLTYGYVANYITASYGKVRHHETH